MRIPLVEHLAIYKQSMQAAGTSARHIEDTMRLSKTLIVDCDFRLLRDVKGESVEKWLVTKQQANMAPRTRNSYLQSLNGFLNWCVDAGKLQSNPLKRVQRADEASDIRRKRRALSETEIRRLLFVARWRPIAEQGRLTERLKEDELPTDSKSRRTWRRVPLTWDNFEAAIERGRDSLTEKPELFEKLDRRGWERCLIYKVAILTGLRRGELESLTVGHLDMSGPVPCLNMEAKDTKNGKADSLPVQDDLRDDLRQWIDSKQKAIAGVVSLKMNSMPPETPLFDNVPRQLVKTLDRDITVAGIPKRDDRGRTVDFHALRHSFGTMLSTSGVSPRTAQEAMRHGKLDLTMTVYTDPRLLDVAGAVEKLPQFQIAGPKPTEPEHQRATGTDDGKSFVAPMVAPARCNGGQFESIQGKETVSGNLADSKSKHEKAPANVMFPGLSLSDADGTRTRNLRIDSPGL